MRNNYFFLSAIVVVAIFGSLNFSNEKTAMKTLTTQRKLSSTKPVCSLSKTEILTSGLWRVDEIFHSLLGVTTSYSRGGKNNTGINYDRMDFVFNADGTGKTTQEHGDVYSFHWRFVDKTERSLILSVDYSISYTWSMLEIAGDYVHATSQMTINGDSNNLESFRLKKAEKDIEYITGAQ